MASETELKPDTRLDVFLREASGAMRRFRSRWTGSGLTAVLALAGVACYAVGIAQKIGVLDAEHVPLSAGIPLFALQDYFVQGLATVTSPRTLGDLALLTMFCFAIVLLSPAGVRAWSSKAAPADAPGEPATQDVPGAATPAPAPPESASSGKSFFKGPLGIVLLILYGIIVWYGIVIVALEPLAVWGPSVAVVVPVVLSAGLLVAPRSPLRPRSLRSWSSAHAGLTAATVVAMVVIHAAVKAYYVPAPLPDVTVQTTTGPTHFGRLLADDDGSVYLIPDPPLGRGEPTITVIPTTSIAKLVIRPGEARSYKTVPQLLGFDTGVFRVRHQGSLHVGYCVWIKPLWPINEC
jgi:hypothetical protein